MGIGVRDLRNRAAQVVEAVRAGERVTLAVHGEPIADIVPHGRRSRWMIAATAIEHGLPVVTQDEDFEQIAGAHPPLCVLNV